MKVSDILHWKVSSTKESFWIICQLLYYHEKYNTLLLKPPKPFFGFDELKPWFVMSSYMCRGTKIISLNFSSLILRSFALRYWRPYLFKASTKFFMSRNFMRSALTQNCEFYGFKTISFSYEKLRFFALYRRLKFILHMLGLKFHTSSQIDHHKYYPVWLRHLTTTIMFQINVVFVFKRRKPIIHSRTLKQPHKKLIRA